MNADVLDMWFIPGIANIKTSCSTFNPRLVIVGFEVEKNYTGAGFILVLGFRISLSSHRCAMLNHSSVTDALKSHQLDSVANNY
jgi:hypothetical protein